MFMMPQTLRPSVAATRRILWPAILIAALVAILGALAVLAFHWPFRRQTVLKQLQEASLSQVDAVVFQSTYFPHPGCILQHVIFRHDSNPGGAPLITIEKLTIEGSFPGLFRKHVRRMRAEGMHIVIPPRNSGERFQTPQRSTVVIDELLADGAILEVTRADNTPPLKFVFHNFSLGNVGGKGRAPFHAKFFNPEPPGEISTDGKFGPWNQPDVGQTPVSGEYLFQDANLSVFHGIAGSLLSSGSFSGVLNHIETEGSTDTPQFAVTSSSHYVPLHTQFHAAVNAENGDTFLDKVTATFLNTTVWSHGSVAGKPGHHGKTTAVDLGVSNGRIEDVLSLFSQSKRAPMSGVTSFRAQVSIPPGKRPFLKKVELQGDFGIDAGSFADANTQQGVNHLSEGARGEKVAAKDEANSPGSSAVLSNLKGHVSLQNGTAQFSNLSFTVPGASATMQGTYNLITEKIDLHGILKTESAPANSTSGAKAAMLKVLTPFLKKRQVGYELPIKITGTYDHPSFGLDLADKQHQKRNQKNWRALQLAPAGH